MQGAAEGRGVAGAKALGEQGADDAREYVARAGLGERGRYMAAFTFGSTIAR